LLVANGVRLPVPAGIPAIDFLTVNDQRLTREVRFLNICRHLFLGCRSVSLRRIGEAGRI